MDKASSNYLDSSSTEKKPAAKKPSQPKAAKPPAEKPKPKKKEAWESSDEDDFVAKPKKENHSDSIQTLAFQNQKQVRVRLS